MSGNSYHVAPNIKGKWSVIKSGSIRALRTFCTQQDAIEYGRKLSIDSRSNLVIHRRDGTVQKKDTYSELAAESI